MSWDDLVKLAPVLTVGATIFGTVVGIAASVCTTWLAGRRQRKEKEAERRALRSDGLRSELRHAYAQFLAAHWKLLNLASEFLVLMVILNEALTTIENHQPSYRFPLKILEEENPQRVAKSRILRDTLSQAMTESAVRLSELLVLEDEPDLHGLLITMFEAPLEWSDDDGSFIPDRLKSQVAAHKERLQALMRALIGAFVPEQWDKRRESALTNSKRESRAVLPLHSTTAR